MPNFFWVFLLLLKPYTYLDHIHLSDPLFDEWVIDIYG